MGTSISYHGGDGEVVSISCRLCWEGINNWVWHLWGAVPLNYSLPKSFTLLGLSIPAASFPQGIFPTPMIWW